MPCPQVPASEIPLETFHRNVSKIKAQQAGHRAERSCSLRPRKAIAFLTHLLRVPRSMGTRDFAVCGRRLRGHVPSKNTSPTALSWISLIWDSFFQSFCFRTMIFVFGASDIDTTIFFPVPYFHRFFHGKSIAIFPKACYTILNFKRALFGTGTEVFYEALRGHLALGTGACRGAGR